MGKTQCSALTSGRTFGISQFIKNCSILRRAAIASFPSLLVLMLLAMMDVRSSGSGVFGKGTAELGCLELFSIHI